MIRIKLDDVALRVGPRVLAQDLTLSLQDGQNWAVLGANGSGKSTLLHTMAGLRPPESGRIHLDGRPIGDWSPRDRAQRLGILFQSQPLTFPATVLETVLTGRHPWVGRWQDEGPGDLAVANAALADLGLTSLVERSLLTLSGGECRRVELAALRAQSAPINLLDEPVNHLDPRHQQTVLRQFTDSVRNSAGLNVMVLHDVNLAVRYCTHALLLRPDGHRAGPIVDVVNTGNLEATYGCAMREVIDHGQSWFVPV